MSTPDKSNGAVSRPGIQEDWLDALGIDHVNTRRRRSSPRKRNPFSRYRQLTDLTRDPDEDTAAIARADRRREFPHRLRSSLF
jgi:hypothetical protein